MFNPLNLALGGFYPGLVTALSIANFGFFDVEVVIEPVVPSGGGGGGFYPVQRNQKPERYRVTVRVKHKGKVYSESIIVDDHEARVTAKKNGIKIFTEDLAMVSLNGIQLFESENVIIKAEFKASK